MTFKFSFFSCNTGNEFGGREFSPTIPLEYRLEHTSPFRKHRLTGRELSGAYRPKHSPQSFQPQPGSLTKIFAETLSTQSISHHLEDGKGLEAERKWYFVSGISQPGLP